MLTLGVNNAVRNRIFTADERVRGELCFPHLGPGAIGTTIAAVLHDVNRTPVLCGRTAHPQ